jgi:hypothetical protein
MQERERERECMGTKRKGTGVEQVWNRNMECKRKQRVEGGTE